MKINRNLIIAINMAALIVLMDLSAINIALPTIKAHFDLSVSTVSFILMASMLTATGSALIMGRLIESLSSAKILIASFIIFGITTSLSAFTNSFYTLIGLRLLQGVAEASLYVIGPALIKQYIKPQNQQKQYGLWMMSCGIGISLGPLLGGLILKYLSWHYVFLINVPLVIIGLAFSWNIDKRIASISIKNHFDYPGAIFSFLFLSLFIVSIKLAAILNPLHIWTLSTGFLSLVFLYLFIKQEKTIPTPIINLKLFNINNFRLANLGFLLFFFVNVGSRFLRPFYFEEARGLNSTTSGLLMMISPAIMLVISFFIANIQKRISTKKLNILGNVLLTISMLMFSFWDSDTTMLFLILSVIILGISMGIYYPTTTQIGMWSLPDNQYGTGSAMISISKSLGKLLGVLIFGLLFQFFFQLINDSHLLLGVLNAKSIQFVFLSAFVISVFNTLLSYRITTKV